MITVGISIFTFIIGLVYASSEINNKLSEMEQDMIKLIDDAKNYKANLSSSRILSLTSLHACRT